MSNASTPHEPRKRTSFDDQFTRATYYVRNDLLERLNKAAQKGGKGEKTYLLNEILQEGLDKRKL